MMTMRSSRMWIVVLLPLIGLAMSTRPDPQRQCTNARKPSNGDVRCSRYDVDDFIWYGGKSRPGSRSKGSGSKSRDCVYACEYSCNKGYKLNGPSVLECPFSVEENPMCVPVQCDMLPRIDHGFLNCTQHFLYGSMCQYSCSSGFRISGPTDILTCGSDGFWNNPVPKCLPVQCPALRAPTHGSISCPTGRSFGSDCRFQCDQRFALDGQFIVSCVDNGNWTYMPPTCKLGECRPLPFLIHGSLTCSNLWDIGSRCTYTCSRGYRLTGGSRVLFCGGNGYWRGTIPTCRKGFHLGKSEDPVLYDDLPYEYTAYDGTTDEVGFGEPMLMESDVPTNSGLNSSELIAILVVAVVVVSICVGLFVAHRHRKNKRRHQYLRQENEEVSYQATVPT